MMVTRRGMTLLEVIISIALIAMLLTVLMMFFWETARTREQTAARAERTQIARQILDRMSSELRGCVGMDQVGFPVEQRLVGDRRSISLLTTAIPPKSLYAFFRENDELPPGQHDLKQIMYRLWIDPEKTTDEGEPIVAGIIRSEKKTLNQYIVDEDEPEQLRNDLWSPELAYLEFRYFDGVEWDVKWDITDGNSLPQLVMITVGFTPITQDEVEDRDLEAFPINEYPYGDELSYADRYSVIVRIPAADKFFSSRIQRVGKQMSGQMGVEGAGP